MFLKITSFSLTFSSNFFFNFDMYLIPLSYNFLKEYQLKIFQIETLKLGKDIELKKQCHNTRHKYT